MQKFCPTDPKDQSGGGKGCELAYGKNVSADETGGQSVQTIGRCRGADITESISEDLVWAERSCRHRCDAGVSGSTGKSLERGVKRSRKGMDHRYFPFFVDITGKKVLQVGAGNIALRRIESLLRFGADVTVAASEIRMEFLQ